MLLLLFSCSQTDEEKDREAEARKAAEAGFEEIVSIIDSREDCCCF